MSASPAKPATLVTFKRLWELNRRKAELMRELGFTLAFNDALARIQVDRKQVVFTIYAKQLGAVDNYRLAREVKKCSSSLCRLYNVNQPYTTSVCSECGEPLTEVVVAVSSSDLRGRFADYMVGVETQDKLRHWFNHPLSKEPWLDGEPLTYLSRSTILKNV